MDEYTLDRYFEFIECKRFDQDLNQFLACERLKDGIYLSEDIECLKHEFAERHYGLKFNSGYSDAHDRAQKRYNGNPWDTNN